VNCSTIMYFNKNSFHESHQKDNASMGGILVKGITVEQPLALKGSVGNPSITATEHNIQQKPKVLRLARQHQEQVENRFGVV
jgi:hypothetical protein